QREPKPVPPVARCSSAKWARCWCDGFLPLAPSTAPGADCLCPRCRKRGRGIVNSSRNILYSATLHRFTIHGLTSSRTFSPSFDQRQCLRFARLYTSICFPTSEISKLNLSIHDPVA